jgi:hypothetical protein
LQNRATNSRRRCCEGNANEFDQIFFKIRHRRALSAAQGMGREKRYPVARRSRSARRPAPLAFTLCYHAIAPAQAFAAAVPSEAVTIFPLTECAAQHMLCSMTIDELREWMRARDLTRKEAAQLLGLTLDALHNRLDGRVPIDPQTARIAALLDERRDK